ncbi:MAG: TIGR03009 domain-containing protein [Thermoguttaceae bacterium]
MHLRLISCTLIAVALATASALAQNNPLREQDRQERPAGPDQPVRPDVPRLIQRPADQPQQQPGAQQPAMQQPPPPPFTLTPEQQAEVDRVLKLWEDHNRTIKTFDCKFNRWTFNVVFSQPGQPLKPQFIEQGDINFAAPDKGRFRLNTEEKDGKQTAIDPMRAEHWLCDGTSIYQYIPSKKRVEQHKLPPELRGKAIANSPLPFLFGSDAQNLKQRYYIRLVTPPAGVNDQIWLEAFPRSQQDAANFSSATLILGAKDLSPCGLEMIQPNKKDFVRYSFENVAINAWRGPFGGDPFRPFTPWGWQMVPDTTPDAPGQAQRAPNDGRR